jgi:DNA-binding CsgD family transcriptional regulator
MLGEELERFIRDAWLRVRGSILSDPQELRRRLARRRLKGLTRPPRAWCIALRASDTRINLANAIITPSHALELDHPLHPYEQIEHEVMLVARTLRRLCRPVRIAAPGQDAEEVAKMLGVTPGSLWYARSRGVFQETYYPRLGGKRGKPVPVLYSREPLDPSYASFYARPDPLWGSMWEMLPDLVPDDFEQTVIRRPYFRRFPIRKTCAGSGRRKLHDVPADHHYKEESKLIGYRWLCPACKKEVRTIYYPVAVRTLFDSDFIDPVIQLKLSDADLMEPPPATFACLGCHGIKYFSSIVPDSWNRLIAYLTGGLLYGEEVAKPASFRPERKRARTRQLNREAPVQRRVLTRLKNGWSSFQIARDLGLTISGVNAHVRRICKEEDVSDRHALAEKLKFAVSPPLNHVERAAVRRFVVKEMLLRNCSCREMREKLSVDQGVLEKDITAIYRLYEVKGLGLQARRALAEKLGVPFVTKGDEIRKKVAELREKGLKWREVAREMGVSETRVASYRQGLRSAEREASLAQKLVETGDSRAC